MIQWRDLLRDLNQETAHEQAWHDLPRLGRGPPRHPGDRRILRTLRRTLRCARPNGSRYFGRKTQPIRSQSITEPYGNAFGTRTAVSVPPLKRIVPLRRRFGSDATTLTLFLIRG